MASKDDGANEKTLLTFITETRNGTFGVVSATAKQLERIEVQREETPEAVYYYSFR